MEVAAGGACRRSEAQQGSDDVTNVVHCEECHDNGRFEVASAFCSNCTDYLCTDCVRQHRRMRRLKDHIILEGAAMPKEKPRDGGDECPEHRGKQIELFCHSDRTLACVICIAESHRTCSNVTSISTLSAGVEQSRELKEVKLSAKKQKTLLGSCIKVIDEYRVLNDGCYDKSVEEFESFKTKIEACMDLLGKRVHRDAGELKEINAKKLDSLSETLKSLEQKLESQMSDVKTKETMKKMDQLFIAIEKNTKYLVENRQRIDEIKTDLHIQTYTFLADPKIQQMLDKMVSTNPIQILSCDVECTAEIGVKATEDQQDCGISGLVEISATDIVAADWNNDCLKLIDSDKEILVARRTLRSKPRDVTVISGSRVAVTLPYKHEIQYFDTQNQLAPCGSIEVGGKCYAIQSKDDTLVVSFRDPGKVEMMDFKGRVKRSFITDSRNTQLFVSPGYLCLSPQHNNIYVTDYLNDVVTCLSTSGRVNWKYKGKYVVQEEWEDRKDEGKEGEAGRKSDDVEEQVHGGNEEQDSEEEVENGDGECCPRGLATGTDGCLYVCSVDSHSIHVVSPAGIKLRVIPVAQYRIQFPGAVCYSKMQGSLYVVSGSTATNYCNFIRRLSLQ